MDDHRESLRALRLIYKRNRFNELRRAILYGQCRIKIGRWPLPMKRIPLAEQGFYDDRSPQSAHNVLSLSTAKLKDAVEALIPTRVALHSTEDTIQTSTQLNVSMIKAILDNLAAGRDMMPKYWATPTFDWQDMLLAALASEISPTVIEAVHRRMAAIFGPCPALSAMCQPPIAVAPQPLELVKSGDESDLGPAHAWIPAQLMAKMRRFESRQLMVNSPHWLQHAHRLTARVDRDRYIRNVEDAFMQQRHQVRRHQGRQINKDEL